MTANRGGALSPAPSWSLRNSCPASGYSAAGIDHDVKEYPEAGHEFLNDHEGAGDKAPPLFAVMARLFPGMGYSEAAAQDARGRILAFFSAHLAPSPPAAC